MLKSLHQKNVWINVLMKNILLMKIFVLLINVQKMNHIIKKLIYQAVILIINVKLNVIIMKSILKDQQIVMLIMSMNVYLVAMRVITNMVINV